MSRFLDSDQCLAIINESYNYVSIEEYGNLQFNEFLRLSQNLLPVGFRDAKKLSQIYHAFLSQPEEEPGA